MERLPPERSENRPAFDRSPNPPEADAIALGELLRQAREHRGLTLQQIASETKIPWRHLAALEHGDLAALPGGMYRRAETRAYADAVGVDRDLALARLERALASKMPREPAAQERRPVPRRTTKGRGIVVAIGVGATAALFGLVLWGRSAPPVDADVDEAVDVRQPADAAPTPRAASPLERGDVSAPSTAVETSIGTSGRAQVQAASRPVHVDGELVVTTEPPGARVTVDGVGWGTSPVKIRYLPLGDKRVRVTKEGYAAAERVVRLGAADPATTIRIRLRSLD